jgi:hypothetical protein
MKKIVIGLLTVCSITAFAGTEVVCEGSFTSTRNAFENQDGRDINTRIKELEKEGKNVTITQLSTSTAVANIVVGKTCVALKY